MAWSLQASLASSMGLADLGVVGNVEFLFFNFLFILETGSHYVDQTSLELREVCLPLPRVLLYLSGR